MGDESVEVDMVEVAKPDANGGWCCDGRTWHEHADADGHCCQPEGTKLEQLPAEGQAKAQQRLEKTAGQSG